MDTLNILCVANGLGMLHKEVKEMENLKYRYKLFCTVTMETYYVEASSEREAKQILARQLGYSISTIDVWK